MITQYPKTFKRALFVTSLVACVSPSLVAAPETIVIHDAPTNENLTLQFRKAQAESLMRPTAEIAVSQDTSKMNKSTNLLEGSIILSCRGAATLVPKGAIIESSDKYTDHLRHSQGDKIVEFSTFAAANRSWLSTHEVSFAQAQGKVPLDPDSKVQMKKSGNVVVATFRGNPIEVMPPAVPAEVAPEIQSQSPNPQL